MKKGKHLVSTNDNYSPAKLPESGQAAIAQWLSDHPQKPARGVYQEVTTLADILPKDSLKMYDEHGTLIYQMLDQGMQTTVPLSQISQNLINAEVAIEDHYFWTGPGVDITGIVRAALANLTHGYVVEGGSTITQQLIKNAIVGDQDTIMRKLQEIILAPEVTRLYSKQEIL